MILIDEILVSDEVVKEYFHCNLNACLGACCWEGDYGAPLDASEVKLLENPDEEILKLLDDTSVNFIETHGAVAEFKENKSLGANVLPDGKCVFLKKEDNGISYCAIEKAHANGSITYNKPISCHLYPIRVEKNDQTGFEALNYDEWDICNPACTMGKEMKMPLYKFCKDALIRKYGDEFYNALDDAAQYTNSK